MRGKITNFTFFGSAIKWHKIQFLVVLSKNIKNIDINLFYWLQINLNNQQQQHLKIFICYIFLILSELSKKVLKILILPKYVINYYRTSGELFENFMNFRLNIELNLKYSSLTSFPGVGWVRSNKQNQTKCSVLGHIEWICFSICYCFWHRNGNQMHCFGDIFNESAVVISCVFIHTFI